MLIKKNDREVDILVYGATGFTGSLVLKYFKTQYFNLNQDEDEDQNNSIKLGIGGRSKEKLKKLIQDLGFNDHDDQGQGRGRRRGQDEGREGGNDQDDRRNQSNHLNRSHQVQVFQVDSSDVNSLDEMCKKTKVLITLVGPYSLYGNEIISSCIKNRTHYLDLTGETFWCYQQISKFENLIHQSNHHDQHREQDKTIIIHSCGYDSVPSDLNVMLVNKEFQNIISSRSSERNDQKALKMGKVTSGAIVRGGVSGGTFSSGLAMYEGGLSTLKKSMSCYLLSPIKGNQKRSSADWVTREPDLVGGFFVMAPHNGAIVRRTWGLLESSKDQKVHQMSYGDRFHYDEFFVTPGVISAFLVTLAFRLMGLILLLPQARMLLKRFGPQSGDGPDEKTRTSGWFKHITTAHSVDDEVQVRVTMHGTGDPGYNWTAACISECAMALVKQHDELPPLAKEGGFLTPATALGEVLVKRLELAKVVRIKKEILKNQH